MLHIFTIQKAKADGNIRVFLIVEPVNPPLPKERHSGDGKRDSIRNTAFSSSIAAGDRRDAAKLQFRGALIGLESGYCHASDLESFDFIHHIVLLPFIYGSIKPQAPFSSLQRGIPPKYRRKPYPAF